MVVWSRGGSETKRERMASFEDIFSEGYLDEFYKTHVASRRTSIDDDIAAIEAEITK